MVKNKNKEISKGSVLADPSQWSEKSKNSVSFEFTKNYRDIEYNCRRCSKTTIYSAEEQKYTYEVKKSHIDKNRVLCPKCWKESLKLTRDIQKCEIKWDDMKETLKNDTDFLSIWLELLVLREKYIPYKKNTATKNMLNKLLEKNA